MLFGAFGKVDPRVNLPIISARGLQRQIGFLLYQNNVQLPFGKLAGNGGAGDAAADDQYIGSLPLQSTVADFRKPLLLRLHFITQDIVDHMGRAVFLGSKPASLHDLRPSGKVPRQHDAPLR